MKALAIVCLLVVVAEAEPTHDDLLGFRMIAGEFSTGDIRYETFGLGLAIEHRVCGQWRITAEYEYLWIDVDDSDIEREGTGHRAHVGLRRKLLQSRWLIRGALALYIDAELGAGVLLPASQIPDAHVVPHAFAGVRVGYTARSDHNKRASPVWQPDLLVRAIGTSDQPVGFMVGLGLHWGD